MVRSTAFIFVLLLAFSSNAQVNFEVKLMSWNVLNFPSNANLVVDTTDRCPSYRTVINYVNPDILVTMENTSVQSPVFFLNQVMNSGMYHYAAGTYINGPDSDNGIYYRDSLFDFVSNIPIETALRDINQFTLVYKATGDTIHIFCVHLKASQGYEAQRGSEVDSLRKVTNAFPAGTNFVVAGDFNIYNAFEPAYTNLLEDNATDDGNFVDVLNLTGIWNNSTYAPYHTQSTHYSSGGGFSTGGLDDRFDMILLSNGVVQPTGVFYMPGTYQNIGNDGNHYGDAINYGANSSAPLAVINALFNTSDHLPVVLSLMVGPTSGIVEQERIASSISIFPYPVTSDSRVSFTVKDKSKVKYSICDAFGREIYAASGIDFEPGEHFLPVDWKKLQTSGFYFLSISIDNYLISKKIVFLK